MQQESSVADDIYQVDGSHASSAVASVMSLACVGAFPISDVAQQGAISDDRSRPSFSMARSVASTRCLWPECLSLCGTHAGGQAVGPQRNDMLPHLTSPVRFRFFPSSLRAPDTAVARPAALSSLAPSACARSHAKPGQAQRHGPAGV